MGLVAQIEVLTAQDWGRYKALRLRALLDAPDAFGTAYADEKDWDAAQWQRRLTGVYVTFAAVRGGQDLGLATGAELRHQTENAGLFGMWVASEARGQGAGDGLVQAVIGWAEARGYQRLFLDVADENTPAIQLYARCGFQPTGQVGTLPPPRDHIAEHERVLDLTGADARP